MHRTNGIGVALSSAHRSDIALRVSAGRFEATTPHRRVAALVCNDRAHPLEYRLYRGDQRMDVGTIEAREQKLLPRKVDYPSGETQMLIRLELYFEGTKIEEFEVLCQSVEHQEQSLGTIPEQEDYAWAQYEAGIGQPGLPPILFTR